MKRVLLLAVVAASQLASASQLRSDAEIRQILADRLKGFEHRVGIAVGIIGPGGRKIFAVGSMGTNDPRPVDGDTLFEAGSITKVFTSLLLADMAERGEVALEDPVARYLPAARQRARAERETDHPARSVDASFFAATDAVEFQSEGSGQPVCGLFGRAALRVLVRP